MPIVSVGTDPSSSLITKFDASIGAPADAAAANDSATASFISLMKRLMATSTTISGKLPTLNNGSLPVIVTGGTSAGTVTQSTYSVTTTVGNALVANPNRRKAFLFNLTTATTNVVLGFTAGLTATTGIPLRPGDGWLEESDIIHTGVFTAIVASASGSLLVWEWV